MESFSTLAMTTTEDVRYSSVSLLGTVGSFTSTGLVVSRIRLPAPGPGRSSHHWALTGSGGPRAGASPVGAADPNIDTHGAGAVF